MDLALCRLVRRTGQAFAMGACVAVLAACGSQDPAEASRTTPTDDKAAAARFGGHGGSGAATAPSTTARGVTPPVQSTSAPEATPAPSAFKPIILSTPPPDSGWDVTVAPPAMPGARVIEIPRDLEPVSWPAYSVFCSGWIHQIRLDAGEDAIIRFSGTVPLRYPLWIDGGRNVRVIGLQMELETQPGCAAGELQNIGGAASVHPRIPGGIALRLEQWGTTFVEGAYIDMLNMEADCLVVRNPDSMPGVTARGQRDIIVQNTACHGIGGLGESDIGDGEHGDLIQNQGDDVVRRMILENVTVRSSSQGVMLHPNQGFRGATELVLRRFDYAFDERYTGKTKYDGPWGLGINASADAFEFDQVWINDLTGLNYGLVNDQRYGVSTSSAVQPHPGIQAGSPPAGPFAPASRTGRYYVSPHP
jgi:hypothetical protein